MPSSPAERGVESVTESPAGSVAEPVRREPFVTRAVGPALVTTTCLYVGLALLHPLGRLFTGAQTAPVLAFYLSVGTAVACGLAAFGLRKRSLSSRGAHAVLVTLGLVMSFNSSMYLWLVPEAVHTSNLILISLSAGLMLSARTALTIALLGAAVGWAVPAALGPRDLDWFHWGAMLFLAQMLSISVFVIRKRTTGRLVALHALAEQRLDEAQKEAAGRKLAEAEGRETERRLFQQQRQEGLGLMAGGVAHDFNNLLTAILGSLELAALETDPTHRSKRLNDARSAAEQAARVSRQMLVYAGRAQLESQTVDLVQLAEEAVALLEVGLPKQVRIRFTTPPDPIWVRGDPTELSQIIVNLVTNAAESYGPAHTGAVDLEVSTRNMDSTAIMRLSHGQGLIPGETACLRVSDFGIGMDVETLERIFDPFFSTKAGGRGLGLASTLGVVRSHDGGLDVRSAPGAGTRVCLYLPIRDDLLIGAPTPDPTSATARPGRRVLVVDDDPRIRELVTTVLKTAGFSAYQADGFRSALAVPSTDLTHTDVALLDVSMPDGNGVELASKLLERNPKIRIVLMSGYDREEALATPAAQSLTFLAKPFRTAELRDVINAELRGQQTSITTEVASDSERQAGDSG